MVEIIIISHINNVSLISHTSRISLVILKYITNKYQNQQFWAINAINLQLIA